ncbi:hypothetical protein M9H77_13056 [Catharanthus roseus]|uniref:Uncharacterized protein n=1 Tax=Catharanthus roseus TaxID=4058 RepID=A0ACC0BJI0_CATRO|nr:hypothetical protein M9H77_13056 [Catharanthus roseus]
MALQNSIRCPKNGLPILLQSRVPAKQIKKLDEAGKNRTSNFSHNKQNRTTNTHNETTITEKSDDWFLCKRGNRDILMQKTDEEVEFRYSIKHSEQWMSLIHKNNLISNSRFSPSQAAQARSQPRMATNSGNNRRIHREQAITYE